MGLKEELSKDKPWAILGITRKQYDSARPWKSAGVSREEFARIVRAAPQELIKSLCDEAHADKLIEAMFGKDTKL